MARIATADRKRTKSTKTKPMRLIASRNTSQFHYIQRSVQFVKEAEGVKSINLLPSGSDRLMLVENLTYQIQVTRKTKMLNMNLI